jgi:5-methylcytosine-specific restriction endonuclease McrA
MQRVLVLSSDKKPLDPCIPVRARLLLDGGKAAVFRRYPFTIILKDRTEADSATSTYRVKIDPGSKATGLAVVNEVTSEVVWAAELMHRGQQIRDALLSRSQIRRCRRNRKTRYRKARFLNRTKPTGWLAPSLMSRVHNIRTWVSRLSRFIPILALSMELVRFDTQLMQNAEISGAEYQQGELAGYEVREYLLEKWGRRCIYCGVKDVPLEIEHITPKARGGSNRVSNLTLACHDCNQKKGTQTAVEFGHPEVQAQAKKPLKDAAAVNATRWKLFECLKAFDIPVECGTGGRTKYNRTRLGFPKSHWIDAACVGATTPDNLKADGVMPLQIKATGHGTRQMCGTNKFGFPVRHRTRSKKHFGFQTGDMVRAIVTKGKNKGAHIGRVLIRATGIFDIRTSSRRVQGINYRYCSAIHMQDGYQYTAIPPHAFRRGLPGG